MTLHNMEATLSVSLSFTVVQTETVDSDFSGGRDGHRVTESSEHSVTIKTQWEGNEKVARALVEVVEAHDERRYAGLLLDEHSDLPAEYLDGTRKDASVSVHLSGAVPAVYLAARKVAADRTKENLCRRGHSVEKVLKAWNNGSGYGFPGWLDNTDNWQNSAHHALFGYCIDQTPGGEIDADAIPPGDERYEVDRDRDEMLPEE